jgi:hypothetical protein
LSNIKKTATQIAKNTDKARRGVDFNKLSSADLADVLKTIAVSYKEYGITKELEATKRDKISVDLQVKLNKIREKRDVLEIYFEKEYAVRRETVCDLLDRLDRAMDEDKNDVAIAALSKLGEIIQASPLRDLDKIGRVFDDPDGELEI